MPNASWDRIETLYEEARRRPPEERDAFLRARCEEEPVRQEVASLLSAREEAPGLFADMAEKALAPMLDELSGGALGDGGRAPRPADPAAVQGRRVGPYRLVEEIGVGGMGVVYRAERAEADFEQTVAVKLLQRPLYAEGAEQRFRTERQVLASLDHPHIARLVGGGVTDGDGGGRPYLVMEYVDGTPITDYAEANDLGAEARLDLFEQVLEAVQAAHRQLVVHRDLKPSNVLVTDTEEGPQVKLLDFGIAKLLDETLPVTRPETRTGQHLMTPSYAAPEQVTGETEVSTATDVYQLGVLAYELLAGARPFDVSDQSLTDIERILLEQTPPRPSERVPDGRGLAPDELQGDLDVIVLTALRKEPAHRYRSAEALAADLQRYRRGEPVEAQPATLGYRARKFVGRHRWGVSVAAAFALLIAAFTGLLLRQQAATEQQRDRARAEAQSATQVSQFLVDLFAASNPYAESTGSITARALLRRGRRRIDDLEDQPAVRAHLLRAMGEAHQGLGNYEQADSLLRTALSLHRRPDLSAPSRRAAVLSALGDLRAANYEWERAQTRFQTARSLLPDRPSSWSRSDSLQAAEVFAGLAETLRNVGSLDSAETAARRALALRRQVHGSSHASTTDAKETLAYVLRKSGSPADAERLYREVLAAERRRGDSLDLAQTLNDLAAISLLEKGDPVEAERLWKKALQIHENQLGPAHPRSLMIRGNNLSFAHELQNDFAAAERVHREQLRVARDRYPPDHWRVGKWAHALGETLLFQGNDLAEAEALLREGVRIFRESEVPDPAYVRAWEAVLGRCLALRGDDRRALPLLRKSRAALASDTIDLSTALSTDLAHANAGLGLIHLRRGHDPRAESLLAAARATFDTKYSRYRDSLDASTVPQPVRQIDRHLHRLPGAQVQAGSGRRRPAGGEERTRGQDGQ